MDALSVAVQILIANAMKLKKGWIEYCPHLHYNPKYCSEINIIECGTCKKDFGGLLTWAQYDELNNLALEFVRKIDKLKPKL